MCLSHCFSIADKMNSKLIFLVVLAFVCYAHARSTKGKICVSFIYQINRSNYKKLWIITIKMFI